MIEENIAFIIKPTAVKQLCVEVESFERRIKQGEKDGLPRSEITLLWMEAVNRRDHFKTATGLIYEPMCEVVPQEKRFLCRLFVDLNGYSWAHNFGWIGQNKTLTRNAVNVFEASTPFYYGINCSSSRSESQRKAVSAVDVINISSKNNQHQATQQPTSVTAKDIDLSGIGCDGKINNQINAITSCEILNLSFNLINGGLPTNLATLSSLSTLNLSCNQLSGILNVQIFRSLTSLTTLDLSFNCFTRTIPDCFDSLVLLETLNLSSNQLTGELPETLSLLTNLRTLKLYSNQLGGRIPDSMSNLQQLRFVNLSQNLFTSGVNAFNNCTRLEQLQLNNNVLKGHVSDSISQLQKLDLLYLQNNQISGSLTNNICQLGQLRYLDVSNNMLRGLIPFDIGNMSRLEKLLLCNNSIVGPVPISIGRLTRLKDFFVFKPYPSMTSTGTRAFDRNAFERTLIYGPSYGIDSMHWDYEKVYGRVRDERDDDSVTLFSGKL